MNTLFLATTSQQAPAMLIIIFWILLILWALGAIGGSFLEPANPNYARFQRGSGVVMLILFAILGYYVFGF